MNILKLTDLSLRDVKHKFKTSILSSLMFFLGTVFFIIFFVIIVYSMKLELPDNLFYLLFNIVPLFFILIVFLIFLMLLFSSIHSLKAALGKDNWIILNTKDGLYIKYRSYLNCHFPRSTNCVLFIPLSEIESVYQSEGKKSKRSLTWYNIYTTNVTYLNIQLNHEDTENLKEALKDERKMKAPQKGLSRTTHQDYPVSLPSPDTIRIEWNSVKPDIKRAVSILSV